MAYASLELRIHESKDLRSVAALQRKYESTEHSFAGITDYDISQPVPQGGFGAKDAENRRIEVIANELRRRRELYEAPCRDSQSHVSPFETEQRAVEAFVSLLLHSIFI